MCMIFEEISFGKNWKVIWKKEISLLLFIPIQITLHGYVSKMKSVRTIGDFGK